MYKVLQNAALIVLVFVGASAISKLTTDGNQLLAIEGIGLLLTVLLAGDALRTLWRD